MSGHGPDGYRPNATHVGPGRPPCECGAAYRLHRQVSEESERGWRLVCPAPYRPDSIEAAQRELEEAQASGDEARVFVARGNLQRLAGRAVVPAPSSPVYRTTEQGLAALEAAQGGEREWPQAREMHHEVGPCVMCERPVSVLQGVPGRPGLEVPMDPGCMLRFIVVWRKWLRGELEPERKPHHRRFLELVQALRPPLEAGQPKVPQE
jgi:hypothetical protein